MKIQTKKHRIKYNKTKRLSLRKKKRTLKSGKLDGGKYFGSGTFGVVVGDPAIPTSSVEKEPNFAYTSKLFFDVGGIKDVQHTIKLLYSIAGPRYYEIFNKYLVLPRITSEGKYILPIDTARYYGEFQSDEYWTNNSGTVERESRDKVHEVSNQVQYVKADKGDLKKVKINDVTDFKKFLQSYIGIINGITELHKYNIIHHDLKPANILVFTQKKYDSYKIADLDSLENISLFTQNNLYKFHSERLFKFWTYNYFPTISVLLPSVISFPKPELNKKNLSSILSSGLSIKNTKKWMSDLLLLVKDAVPILKQKIPNNTYLLSIIMKIINEKYGASQADSNYIYQLINGTNKEEIIQKLVNINSGHLNILKQIYDTKGFFKVRNLLIKYVDIYAVGMTFFEKIIDYINNSSEEFSDEIKNLLERALRFSSYLLVFDEYIKNKIYALDLHDLYVGIIFKNIEITALPVSSF